MTRFILHVGDGKCGSSSIQTALFHARADLRAQGIIYESHHSSSGNFCLSTLVGGTTRGDDAGQRRIATDTVAAIRAGLATADHVILSSESFLRQSPANIMAILHMITPDISGIDVIAYVRHPVAMYLSLAQQAIKASTRFTSPASYRRPLDEALVRWESCSGVESLTVRLFDRAAMVGGDVVPDFQAILERLTERTIPLAPVRENQSLSAEQMVALQHYRHHHCLQEQGKETAGSVALIDCFERMNRDGLVGTRPVLKARAAALVLRNNRDIMQALSDRYGLTGMAAPAEPPETDDGQGNWSSIASIMAQVDRQQIDALKRILPDSKSGSPGRDAAALAQLMAASPDKAEAIENAVRRYWTDATG
ncbi:hypothetical protein [Sphingobium lactosutens]|uniref:hypothetical protein n=1 Tax=Sphingobium lactosutens TaxID=522773 RepID=UPI0015BE2E97|nr:hypothetical protein [Sphingobium lactosutens]